MPLLYESLQEMVAIMKCYLKLANSLGVIQWLILICLTVNPGFSKKWSTASLRLREFKLCLGKTSAELSYPSNETWWYDSQSFQVIDLKHPLAVGYAENAAQVQALVKCAVKYNVKINPRSGGHSFESFCNEDDHFVIDVSRINYVIVNDDSQTANVGAGIRLGPLTYELGKRKFAYSAGVDNTIGLGGNIAAGGIGLLMRLWGIGVDNVLEMEMVDCNGKLLVANNKINKELYFALRGGGGGSYGIVTSMKLKIYPYPALSTAFTITWHAPIKVSDFCKAWFKWKPWETMPREMSFYVSIFKNNSELIGLYVKEDGHEGLDRVIQESGLLQVGPAGSQDYKYYSSEDLVLAREWLDDGHVAEGNEWDYHSFNIPSSYIFNSLQLPPYPSPVPPSWVPIQKDPRVNATHSIQSVGSTGPIRNQTALLRNRAYLRNSNQEFDNAAYEAIEEFVSRGGMPSFMPFGGIISTIPENFNAFPHRKEPFLIEYLNPYFPEGTHNPSGLEAQRIAAEKIHEAMEPYSNHRSYQGNPDLLWTTDPKKYMPRYYGNNVDRLVRAKITYDPNDFFNNRQSTPNSFYKIHG